MNTREFTELLKGCRPVKDSDGNIIVQSILNMQIVCLTTDKEYSLDTRFANPLTALKASNRSYGEVGFSNEADKEVIVPTQMAVMTKQSAQNHGMTKGGYIGANKSTTFHDAGCVQGSQGGHFRGTQEFRMLPVSIREMVFDAGKDGDGYSRIYPAICELGRQTNSNTGEYLDKYFNKYDKKLEQFIAHFERPKNLIGTIVLVDGEIIAIDKFPSFTYAEQVWDIMIRDCYGALAIMSELKSRSTRQEFTETYKELKKSHQANVIDLLEKALKKTKADMTASVHEKLQEVLELTFNATLDTEGHTSGARAPKSYRLESTPSGYVGQVISETEYNHLVSVVKRDKFDPNTLREINELRKMARRQDRFSL